jgi:hypothetical protein
MLSGYNERERPEQYLEGEEVQKQVLRGTQKVGKKKPNTPFYIQ